MNAVDASESERSQTVVPLAGVARAPHRLALSNRERRVAIAIADFLIGALACYIAFVGIRHPHLHDLEVYEPVVIGLFWVVSLLAVDGYASQVPGDRSISGFAVLKAAPIASLLTVLVFFIHPYVLTRSVIAVALLVGAAMLIAFRLTAARLLLHDSLATRVVVVSDAQPSDELAQALGAARFEYREVGSLIGASPAELAPNVRELLA